MTALADGIVAAALETPGRPAVVVGPPGSGKSRLAADVVARAGRLGKLPIWLAPPTNAPEAGPIAVATALEVLSGQAGVQTRGWVDALTRLRLLLYERQDEVLVVCDEPSAWARGERHFSQLAGDAVDIVLPPEGAWPAVVVDQRSRTAPLRVLRPEVGESPDLSSEWGELAEAARILELGSLRGPSRNQLEQRLAVALTAWSDRPPPDGAPIGVLAEELARALALRRHGRPLWAVWQRIALARTTLAEQTLAVLGAHGLTPVADATLRLCLLDGNRRLHDVLRSLAQDRPPPPRLSRAEQESVHRLLYEHHVDRLRVLLDSGEVGAAEAAAEAMHHAAELRDETLMDGLPVLFGEQLNALGQRLSRLHRDHESAASVFLRAVQLDARDDYAQHYRAFNLDFLGNEIHEVQQRYAEALRLEPANPWWHARYIVFLADTGQLRQARIAWARAESDAVAPASDAPETYAQLHEWVATALLQQGELTFAMHVLDDVPEWAVTSEHDRLRAAVEARLEAQDAGTVVPAPRSRTAWWTEPPARLQSRDSSGRTLVQWMAGRVAAVDEDGVELRVGLVREGEEPDLGTTLLNRQTWQARCLDDVAVDELRPGRFVELGRYESSDGSSVTVVVVLPEEPAPSGLAPLMPLERWLDRSAVVAPPAATA